MTTDLAKLIADLEEAKEGSRELSDRVLLANGWDIDCDAQDPTGDTWVSPDGQMHAPELVPDPSESVGAALQLVPEGWAVARVSQDDDKLWHCELRQGHLTSYDAVMIAPNRLQGVPTPALALCAACLRARLAE